MTLYQKLNKKLKQIENELKSVRGCSPLTDGWQTQRYAKKSRKWDLLAQEKMKIIFELEEINKRQMEEIVKIYFENKTEKANRLNIPRITMYSWINNPNRADINLIEKDVRALLQLIEDYKAANAM